VASVELLSVGSAADWSDAVGLAESSVVGSVFSVSGVSVSGVGVASWLSFAGLAMVVADLSGFDERF
ncbi:MAG: hypothetical protein KDA55_11690, partial [Planctomycetales bacterium]|nr:hypothetical protein [Planctomycetales bacterium]